MPISPNTPLATLKNQLEELKNKKVPYVYNVPSLWTPIGTEGSNDGTPIKVNPAEFFLNHIDGIEKNALSDVDPIKSLNGQLPDGNGGNWIEKETIFNVFVRLTSAYDHDADGQIGGNKKDLTLNLEGCRESGTFLKSIALLGYIKRLGASVIHLLPVTAIGKDGNKGELGSPYAIQNPYRLEATQADPLVNMDVEEQFKAFIQACHLVGIRVITEFVFRTASKDSDWIKEHPEWFYWIDEKVADRDPSEKNLDVAAQNYGNPIFSREVLDIINRKVESSDFNDLPAPPENYRNFFKAIPAPESIQMKENGEIRASSEDPKTGLRNTVRIPGAFADWPPDDNQPPWGDVTYLRMYNDENHDAPEFNYIAYNTIRMYDKKLARPELANKSLWKHLRELVPYYQDTFGIDGVMVDMGHAVPVSLMQEIINAAREKDPDFAFLSENFEIKDDSVEAGYNAVVGYAWWVEYRRDGMYDLLNHIGNQGVPLSFFGAVENHNTPRAAGREGGLQYAKYAFLVNTMLPRAIPFIHSGQELGEVVPVNTGLDFSNDDLERIKGSKLALFDLCGYKWDGEHEMLDFMKKVLEVRKNFSAAAMDKSTESFGLLETGFQDVICFLRKSGDQHILVLFNRDLNNEKSGSIKLDWCLPSETSFLENLVQFSGDSNWKIESGHMAYTLKPGDSALFAW